MLSYYQAVELSSCRTIELLHYWAVNFRYILLAVRVIGNQKIQYTFLNVYLNYGTTCFINKKASTNMQCLFLQYIWSSCNIISVKVGNVRNTEWKNWQISNDPSYRQHPSNLTGIDGGVLFVSSLSLVVGGGSRNIRGSGCYKSFVLKKSMQGQLASFNLLVID